MVGNAALKADAPSMAVVHMCALFIGELDFKNTGCEGFDYGTDLTAEEPFFGKVGGQSDDIKELNHAVLLCHKQYLSKHVASSQSKFAVASKDNPSRSNGRTAVCRSD